MDHPTDALPQPRTSGEGARTHALLCAGVPLSLLLDLVDPRGPRSSELYDAEQADAAWLQG
ncbi:MAG: hypothetical protein JWO60_1977 [Frankiales bacterium]|nr:hypothetical protein [Frankiales bacterium]